MAEKEGGALDRDFAYLMPFLEKVQAAGSGLPAGSREELAALVAGERDRWTRIRALLAGGGAPATAPQARASSPTPTGGSGFTVGTLRARGS
jgi:hypothetical protein